METDAQLIQYAVETLRDLSTAERAGLYGTDTAGTFGVVEIRTAEDVHMFTIPVPLGREQAMAEHFAKGGYITVARVIP